MRWTDRGCYNLCDCCPPRCPPAAPDLYWQPCPRLLFLPAFLEEGSQATPSWAAKPTFFLGRPLPSLLESKTAQAACALLRGPTLV